MSLSVSASLAAKVEEEAYNRGFDQGFRACLDQIALTGLTPTSESTVKEFVQAARRRLGMSGPRKPSSEPGYSSIVVVVFVHSLATFREKDERVETFNGIKVTDSHRDMLDRWATWDTVPLHKVDAFLMRYDLMLFELEHWADAKLGWSGYVDPLADPAGVRT